MKLTWFGGRTLRVHIGGRILVVEPTAFAGVDPGELVSGADRVVTFADDLPVLDGRHWQPRRAVAAIDDDQPSEVLIHRIGEQALLVDAAGEAPLLVGRPPYDAGRWARDAVLVAFAADEAVSAVERLGPRLVACAMPDAAVAEAFMTLRERLGGTALVELEVGMGLEV